MGQLGRVRVESDKHPRAVEIGGFGGSTCVNKHGGGLDAVGFHADPVDAVAKAGKHLAAHFPAIKLGRGVGSGGPAQGATYGVDVISGHVTKVALIFGECKYGANWWKCWTLEVLPVSDFHMKSTMIIICCIISC